MLLQNESTYLEKNKSQSSHSKNIYKLTYNIKVSVVDIFST